MTVAPLYVLLPLRIRVPLSALISEPVPETTPLSVRLSPLPTLTLLFALSSMTLLLRVVELLTIRRPAF